jgi:hypothetical protein
MAALLFSDVEAARDGTLESRRVSRSCCGWRSFAAWLDDEIVTIPDQVADDQRTHDKARTVFPALTRDDREIKVRLDGAAYGLHTPGTGDCRVVVAVEVPPPSKLEQALDKVIDELEKLSSEGDEPTIDKALDELSVEQLSSEGDEAKGVRAALDRLDDFIEQLEAGDTEAARDGTL